MNDYLIRSTTENGFLRASAALTTVLTGEICALQGTDPTATVALGRLIAGAALCGSLLKGDQRLAIAIEANGPIQKMQAETDSAGRLKASIKQPVSGVLPNKDGFDVAGAIGHAGFLHMAKDLGLKEPYRGMVQLMNSEVGSDLAYYFTHSEQTPTSVGVGVTLGPDAQPAAAGGFLIQAMPGCPDEILLDLEKRLLALPLVSGLILEGTSAEGILERIFADIPHTLYDRQPLQFHCSCNFRQAGRLLRLLGNDELAELVQKKEQTIITCEYCRQAYPFTPEEIKALLESKTSDKATNTVQ